MKSPEVFDYLDYREFLEDIFDYLKANAKFTVRKFADQVGFGSSNYLRMILDRKRNLSLRYARQVGHRLGLRRAQLEFFEALVTFCDAKEGPKKDRAYQKLLKFKDFKKIRQLAEAEYDLFRVWYIVALYEALGQWSEKPIPEIAETMGIKPAEVKDALTVLVQLGLVKERAGEFVKVDKAIETPPLVRGVLMRNFHSQMLDRAKVATQNLAADDRELGSLTIPLDRENYEKIKERLFNFQQEINAAHSDVKDPDKIYQLNYQLFPLFPLK